MPVRIVAGEINAKDATTRSVIPTSAQSVWPPLERVAETIATPRRRFPSHGHEGAEVLSYVIEGSGLYSFGGGRPEPISAGRVHLLVASTHVAHAINPAEGQTLRWLGVVVDLPAGATPANGLQSARVDAGPIAPDGSRTAYLVGPGSSVRSVAGLEAVEVSFAESGTTFRKVGHAVNAVAYVLSGSGSIDGRPVELGEAAMIDGSSGVAIQGRAGFRVALIQVPRPG